MALFGKKAKNSSGEVPNGASNVPVAESGADPFAADVFASDDAAPSPVETGGKKGRASKAPKAPKARSIKNGSVVGLNIGNTFIKAVEVTAKNGEISVTGVAIVPTPAESYVNGNILSVSALAAALRNLWKQGGFKGKTTVLSVSGTGSLVVRVIDVPKMSDGELTDNMRVDADRYIPFPPSEVVMDFKALRELPSDPDATNMEVLLAAAQREVIDLHVKVIQSAKLNPSAIDVEPIATARAIQLEKRKTSEIVDYDDVTALLNIGATGTEITVLRGDIVVFTRSLPNGGNNITTAISESFGVNFSDAERIKIERADALPPAGYDQTASFGDDAFDEFSGGDIGAFSDDVFGGGSSTQAATASSTQTATSDDPFDLDFFNQGPKQDEPGAGHSQKDGEKSDSTPISFNFSFDEDTSSMPSTQNPIPAADSDPNPPVPPSFEEPPAKLLPTSPDLNAPATAAGNQASPVNFDFEGNIPSTTNAGLGTIPSAFDFSDFDLPTVAEPEAASADSETPTTTTEVAAPQATFAEPTDDPFAASATTFGFVQQNAETDAEVEVPNSSSQDIEETSAGFGFTPITDSSDEAPAISAGNAENTEAIEDLPSFDSGMNFDDIQLGSENANASGFDIGSSLNENSFAEGEMMGFGAGLGEASLVDADEAALYTAIAPVLEELSNEVRRSLEFHLGRYPDTSFSKILLVGGGANLRNLDVYFTQNIGVPTQVANPFSFVNISDAKMSDETIAANGPLCATALGLALRDFID
jgi:type IV pilus assembly protein PilM